ncbi:hypothetical protein HHL25_02015 [Rhizobium sp. S-51]|uniref:Uncharacterized protein n=1 Tax=Rhizobium terricola TaxID=2728849 RepID=A0A7Y0AT05_9HYPH|nr:hypothetical protein [Rhizobium terricola]NML72893.1 hypothetical protein [Rhizobium terricola]
MSKLEKLEQAVSALDAEEFASFSAWFEAQQAARFDRRIAEDAKAGHLDGLAGAALGEHRQHRTRPL